MPTDQELSELNTNCDWTWTTQNSVNGYIVRGRGVYATNSIFLPCVNLDHGTSIHGVGWCGLYWSSAPRWYSSYAWSLLFHSREHSTRYSDRYYWYSIRPVQGFAN